MLAEFRTRGSNGASDEFIELYNVSGATVDIGNWRVMRATSTGGTTTVATILSGTLLAAGKHYLLTHATGYSGTVPGDQTYGAGVIDNTGLGLLNSNGTLVDAVGLNATSPYSEGAVLTPMTADRNQSYERKPGSPGQPQQDTDNNLTDFRYNDGVSFPENLASPTAPTAVTLLGFVAEAIEDGVLLSWQTADERALQGFNLYRSQTLTDPGDKLNTALILAQAPDNPVGSTYTWLDTEQPDVGAGAYYWLETIDLSGAAARTGPITVVAPTGSARQFYLPFVVR